VYIKHTSDTGQCATYWCNESTVITNLQRYGAVITIFCFLIELEQIEIGNFSDALDMRVSLIEPQRRISTIIAT